MTGFQFYRCQSFFQITPRYFSAKGYWEITWGKWLLSRTHDEDDPAA